MIRDLFPNRDLDRLARSRRRRDTFVTVKPREAEEYEARGWQVAKRNKNSDVSLGQKQRVSGSEGSRLGDVGLNGIHIHFRTRRSTPERDPERRNRADEPVGRRRRGR